MKENIDIDWGNLPFGYYPTDYNVRCYFAMENGVNLK